ncbi:hypothetical protein ACBI99_26335 [Nonomuraea sp. ATR24]|nr:hypothetical protein [Nonomuraea ceibae]
MKLIDRLIPTLKARAAADCVLISKNCYPDGMCCYVYRCGTRYEKVCG